MKIKNKISATFIAVITLATLVAGCSNDILTESPYTSFTTEYFKTADGLQNGVNAVYAGMRYDYGPMGALDISNVGTDEWSFGDQGLSGDVFQEGTYITTSSDGAILTAWNRNYWHINLCNAILQYAPGVSMSESDKTTAMAEAHYLRAHLYMCLVEQFGAVPLNLGAGDLQFNTNPSSEFFRLPVNDVLIKDYKAIISDLIYASQNLPDKRPVAAFKLSKAAALHLLARAYLFRGYSSVAKVSTDFDSAYFYAKKLIDNRATYGCDLLQDYGDVHKVGNDYNQEVLYSVERLSQNNSANEYQAPSSDFANKVNIANNMFNCNYQQPTFKNSSIGCIDGRPLQYGRPLRRYCPTKWLLDTAFAEKANDSRFDNSFRTVWLAASVNASGTSAYTTYVNNLTSLGLAIGDTAIVLCPTVDAYNARVAYANAKNKRYAIYGPNQFYNHGYNQLSNLVFPNLKKYDDPNRANFQDVSGRPFIVSKLSETYLIAAEAALQAGHPADAVPLLNTIRERAAYRPGLSATDLAARKLAMDIDVSKVTLDFIMDERTRELCGESKRWPDLAVRGLLVRRVKAHNPDGATNVKDFHMLKPIPLTQLDAISDPDKAKYQNPGY
ncbi:MAG: RagB/SusD family nutrient uptake outer membrane protein [Bacteroidota bacterium]|nr:RagB/SusD family nutrient uptake outer membrane protein [Bacteroidota bacterium]